MISDHYRNKLEINNRKTTRKSLDGQKLNDTFLNKLWDNSLKGSLKLQRTE